VTDVEGCTGLDMATVIHRDGTVALREITLLARPGELLAVLGPSGSGKSTALRAIAGLVKTTAGRVLIAGQPTTAEPARRDIAMVFDNTRLVPFLDVARNMGFGLEVRHIPKDQAAARVQHQARRLRISRLLSRKAGTISAGENGQVGIGRALVRRPKAFLLDEPLAHVDAQERVRMRRVIADTVKEAGVSTVYVTHDQSDALAIGDRIAVVNEGRVVQLGTSSELYDEPVDLFVADFIGPMRIGQLPARVIASAGMTGYQVGRRTLPTWAPVPPALAGHVGRDVMLGLRAEDVRIASGDMDPDLATLTGTVRSAERNGRDAFVTIQIDRHRVVARMPGRTDVRIGDTVTVAIDASRAHVFESGTGRALAHPSH